MTEKIEFYKESRLKQTEVGAIPTEWDAVRLGEIVKDKGIYYGITAKATEKETSLRMLRTTDIKNYCTSWDALPLCEITEKRNDLTKYFLRKGDLIVARAGTTGMSVLVDRDQENIIFGSYLIKIKLKSDLYPKFIHYFFQSKFYWTYITSGQAGSTLKNINLPTLKSLNIPLPKKIEEQQKIASILSGVDEAIQKTNEIIQKTQELKKGLMQELLTKGIGHKEFKYSEVGRIPKEWKVIKINQISEVRRGASPRPIGDPKYFSDKGRGWVRISDVTRTCKYLRKASQYLSKLGESRSVKVNPGDLIMSICATIGKPIIVDMHACIHDGFVIFRNLSNRIIPEFFFYVLQRNEPIFLSMKQTGTQGNLNTTLVGRTLVSLPPLVEQQKVVSIFSDVDEKIKKERQTKEQLQKLKRGLMQILLTGKVRVRAS